MKKTAATVLLIILNIGGEALIILLMAILSPVFSRIGVPIYALALAVLDMPIMFVYRKFRGKYGFTKGKFFLCTLIAPFVPAISFGIVIYMNMAEGTDYGGLAGFAFAVALIGATVFLAVCTIVWTALSDLFERR